MQNRIYLEDLDHRGRHCIAIRGSLEPAEHTKIRNHPRRLYSKTHGCWYLPFSEEDLGWLRRELNAEDRTRNREHTSIVMSSNGSISNAKLPLPKGYHEQLVRLRYSEATWENYESQLRQFIAWLRPKTLDDINDEVVKGYLFYLANDRKVSISTQNTAINAIKFYLEKVHRGERKVYYVDRPMKEVKLPHVLTQEEVKELLTVTKNIKHRCMLLVLYSTGVRMSELLNLRWSDFDPSKLQVFIHGGKGRKDRLTITSRMTIDYILHYQQHYDTQEYLFEGPGGGKYSPRSVNQIIQRSAGFAGISKRVSAHTLRHSFATHLLEDRVDIRYIQMLMGHESSKTTERYTHMTTKGFSGIKSPLDGLGIDFRIPSPKGNKGI